MRREAASAGFLVVWAIVLALLVWFFILEQRVDSQQDEELKAKLLISAPK